MSQEIDDPRRAFLVDALALGFFATGVSGILQPVHALGDKPIVVPEGRSIYKLKGKVTVDDVDANIETQIRANSLVKTGSSSRVIFVVGDDAFILRSNSQLQLGGGGFLIAGMRLLTGKILAVFGKRQRPHKITTPTATIGIRGTGIYVESDEEKSYVCTCYGHTEIVSSVDANQSEQIITQHHDNPRYIFAAGVSTGNIIQPAPFINHTDAELALIEELVGRTPPFAVAGGAYELPRNTIY